MFAVQGGLYLLIKTDGELHERIERTRAAADARVLRPQHARGHRDGGVRAGRHESVPDGHLAGHLPRPRPSPRWSRRGSSSDAARTSGPSVLVGDDRAAAHLGRDRALPEPHHLDDRPGQQPDHLQRGVGREHAGDHPVRRAHRDARSCCSTRRASTTSSGARPSSTRTATRASHRPDDASAGDPHRSPGARVCWASQPGARTRLAARRSACGFGAAVVVVVQACLVSVVVAEVFLGGADLETRRAGARRRGAARRPACPAARSRVTRPRAASRRSLTRGRLRGRPDGRTCWRSGRLDTGRERTGELAGVALDGLDAIDAYLTTFQPARALAVAVPLFVLAAVVVVDPPTALVLLFTGPVLVLLLGVHRRPDAHDHGASVRRGPLARRLLPRHAGRPGHAQDVRSQRASRSTTIRTISRQYGETTMEVLRTAFQTSLVLEWGARGRGRARRGRDQPAPDGGRDRVRSRARGADHRARVLPAAPPAGGALPLGCGGSRRRGARVRDPRRAAAGEPPQRVEPGAGRDSGRRPDGPPTWRSLRGRHVHVPRSDRTRAARPRPDDPRTGAWPRWWRRPAPARRRSRVCCCGSSSPTAGRILVGEGSSLASIDLGGLAGDASPGCRRRRISSTAAIADNIRLARPDATDDAVRRPPARPARTTSSRALPRGYDTPSGRAACA